MKRIEKIDWVYYLGECMDLEVDESGKWVYDFEDSIVVEELCEYAVAHDLVQASKYCKVGRGVACFYLNKKDTKGHKRFLSYLLQQNLIPKTATGRLQNLSFLGDQPIREEKDEINHPAPLTLETFIDLDSAQQIM